MSATPPAAEHAEAESAHPPVAEHAEADVVHPPAPARTALITGGTAGIGNAFAWRLAADGWNLVLVARDGRRLGEVCAALAAEHGVEVTPLVADLATDEGCETVAARVADPDHPVDLLVNNAGLSLNTPFVQSTPEKERLLLAVNVGAVMRLTLAAVPAMVDRGGGSVINVSSVSAFGAAMPGSTYPASKAWVNNFSESVALSVAGRDVRVMALCPGFTRTEFHQRAGIDMTKTADWLWLDPHRVVADALRDLERGRLLSVPSLKYKILVAIMKHTPSKLLRFLARRARVRTGRDTE